MEEKLKRIMSNVFQISPDEIDENISTETLENWDSLQHLNLILAIEQGFNVSLATEDVVKMTSLKAIEEVLGRYVM